MNIEELFQKIKQGNEAKEEIREHFGPGVESDLKGKQIRYTFHLTNAIISATINRCLLRYGKKVTQSKFDENLKKSFEEQYFVHCIRHHVEVKHDKIYTTIQDKYILCCSNHITINVSGLSDSDIKEIATETWSEFVEQLSARKHFELTTSLEQYLKEIAKNKAIEFTEKKGGKTGYNDVSTIGNSNSKNNEELSIDIDMVIKYALMVFCKLKDSQCKDFLRFYYHPILSSVVFTKDDLQKLAQNELEQIKRIQNQSIIKKLSQKEALEQAGIPHKKHPETKHQICLTEWQMELYKKSQRYPKSATATFINHIKERYNENKGIKGIYEN